MRSPTKHPYVLLQVFHLLNALVCILRSVVFGMHNRVQHISPPILGRVLLDLPGLLFFTTYTLLVSAPIGKLFADAVLDSCCLAGIVSSRHSKSDGWTGCTFHHACCYLSARCQWQGAYSSAQTVKDLSMGHACCAANQLLVVISLQSYDSSAAPCHLWLQACFKDMTTSPINPVCQLTRY